jgi:hypothetical protein
LHTIARFEAFTAVKIQNDEAFWVVRPCLDLNLALSPPCKWIWIQNPLA